jgi:hypothetical protein
MDVNPPQPIVNHPDRKGAVSGRSRCDREGALVDPRDFDSRSSDDEPRLEADELFGSREAWE